VEANQVITLREVYSARKRIAPFVRRTPLVQSEELSARLGVGVYLKLETEQMTRSFKVRGAANRLLQLSPSERDRGVITVSTGNHGKAVAFIARQLGMRAIVCVPQSVLQHKVHAIQDLGAEVVMRGADQDEAEEHAVKFAADEGVTLISPFDDPAVIAGQGTIALEILEDLPETDTAVVPLSGGGLMAGIALTLKQASRNIRTVAASMERGPVMYWSLHAGHPVYQPEEPTIADSLMGGIGLRNRYTFDLVRKYVDEAVLVSEQEIAASMAFALKEDHVVAEGGGAVGIGAVLFHKIKSGAKTIVVVVSGGNADMAVLQGLAVDDSSAGGEGGIMSIL
jgi:threonine dehydratase